MTNQEILSASSVIIKTAKQLWVDLAGFANVDDLRVAPSYVFAPQLPSVESVIGALEGEMGLSPARVKWAEDAKSILVVALEHPEDKPEMDWWYGQKSSSGNKLLINAVKELCKWVPANFDIDVFHLPYFIEQGGVYLKDAAVIAGLGCIGRNNMVVTPEFGPRVRLRAMALSVPIPSTGPSGFNPCIKCDDRCRKACPQRAFDEPICSTDSHDVAAIPGRDGSYARHSCHIQIVKDNDETRETTLEGMPERGKVVKFCRNCEWSCPVGR